jgi:hypothetical protein
MTADERLSEHIRTAFERGDKELIELVIKIVLEADEAKRNLRRKGYGCTGRGLLDTVEEVPYSEDWEPEPIYGPTMVPESLRFSGPEFKYPGSLAAALLDDNGQTT